LNTLRALTDSRTYRALLFLASAVPLGAVEFALLLAGWIAVPLLALTPASVPALLGYRWSVRQVALVEAWLARELVGSRAALPPARPRPRGYWRAGQSVVADAAFWRQQAYLFYRATGCWALGVVQRSHRSWRAPRGSWRRASSAPGRPAGQWTSAVGAAHLPSTPGPTAWSVWRSLRSGR
jgi:hypothetical protein